MLKKTRFYLFVLALLFISGIGCSSNSMNTSLMPDENGDQEIPITKVNESLTGSELAGVWTADFNLDSLSASVIKDRDSEAHFKVTQYLPFPEIDINNYNSSTNVVDVDITVNNTTTISAYDLRLIIYTDNIGHKLLNADSWTSLYDISGGLPINPFKAYAKTQSNRLFAGKLRYTENFQIYLPGGNSQVKFAIEASYPSNCAEPYEISGFSHGVLNDESGSSCNASVTVKDWQNDVKSVNLFCPSITGVTLRPFSHLTGEEWGMTLINSTGAAAGQYTGFVFADSTNSAGLSLYNEVKITISHTGSTEPVGNLVITVNRRPANSDPNRFSFGILHDRPWTLSWEMASGAAEYAIYCDDDPLDGVDNNFEFVGTADSSATSYDVPASHFPDNNYVPGITYIVRSRAVAGDPSSETEDSEQAHIIVTCFDTLDHNAPFGVPGRPSEGWTTAVERNPYSTLISWPFWPITHQQADYATSDPSRLSVIPTYFGADWTSGAGQQSDYYPGHIVADTIETPSIPDSSTRLLQFVGFCSNLWDPVNEGGIIMGSADGPTPPKDGFDGSTFKWAQAYGEAQGYEPYKHTHPYNPAYPFPFDMSDYTAGPNCWRWEG